jgi:hypothetical protein
MAYPSENGGKFLAPQKRHQPHLFQAIKLPALQLTAPIVEEGCKIAKSIVLARLF